MLSTEEQAARLYEMNAGMLATMPPTRLLLLCRCKASKAAYRCGYSAEMEAAIAKLDAEGLTDLFLRLRT